MGSGISSKSQSEGDPPVHELSPHFPKVPRLQEMQRHLGGRTKSWSRWMSYLPLPESGRTRRQRRRCFLTELSLSARLPLGS